MIEAYLKRSKYRKEIILAVPLIGGLLLGYMVLIKPALFSIKKMKAEVTGLSAKATPYQSLVAAEAELDQLRAQLAVPMDKSTFIQKINESAPKSGYSITSITPEEESVEGGLIKRLTLRIEGESSFHQLGQFVGRLESLPGYVRITEADFTSSSTELPAFSPAGLAIQQAANKRRGVFGSVLKVSSCSLADAAPAKGAKLK